MVEYRNRLLLLHCPSFNQTSLLEEIAFHGSIYKSGENITQILKSINTLVHNPYIISNTLSYFKSHSLSLNGCIKGEEVDAQRAT